MRVFKTAGFVRFTRKERLAEESLRNMVREIEQGLPGSSLGGSVYKKRLARPGRGKSAGYRIIHAWSRGKILFLIEGYAKNELQNLSKRELTAVRNLAAIMLSWKNIELEILLKGKVLEELE